MALPRRADRPARRRGHLVSFALESGGMDNVTVVLAPYPPQPRPPGSHDEPEEKPADEPA